jgi:hypothetical protein
LPNLFDAARARCDARDHVAQGSLRASSTVLSSGCAEVRAARFKTIQVWQNDFPFRSQTSAYFFYGHCTAGRNDAFITYPGCCGG